MRLSMNHTMIMYVLLLTGLLPLVTLADSDGLRAPYIKPYYVSLGFNATKVLGDFDGESLIYYQKNATLKTAILPSSGMGTGLDFLVGFRFRRVAWEFFYASANYKGTWADFPVDMSSKRGGTNIILYFAGTDQVKPLILASGFYQSVNIKDGSDWFQWEYSFEEDDYNWRYLGSSDATFGGLGGAIGPGVHVYLSPSLSFRNEVVYNFAFFSTVKMAGDQSGSKIGERYSANGYSLNVRMILSF